MEELTPESLVIPWIDSAQDYLRRLADGLDAGTIQIVSMAFDGEASHRKRGRLELEWVIANPLKTAEELKAIFVKEPAQQDWLMNEIINAFMGKAS